MKRIIGTGLFAAGICTCLLLVGCASYYKVIDPQSGREYYTQEIETVKGGAVKLKDARSGSTVTLQNSEVKEISSADYKAGLAAPAKQPTMQSSTPASAAPAPAPASAATGTAAPEAAGQAK